MIKLIYEVDEINKPYGVTDRVEMTMNDTSEASYWELQEQFDAFLRACSYSVPHREEDVE